MIHYKKIDFEAGESYKYKLLKKKIYVIGINLGEWELISPEGTIVAKCYGSVIGVYPEYMWDGCTVIGEQYEDEMTLEASLLHDVLYNAKKNPNNIKVPFSLVTADKIFCDLMKCLYKNHKGTFFQKYIFPKIYLAGLLTVGMPWKFGKNEYYRLKLC